MDPEGAAALLGAAAERLVTVADDDTLAEIGSVLRGVPVDPTPRLHRIEFAYDTPLSPPRLHMHKSDQGIDVPNVVADDVVVFGMVEAQPAVTARRAVVDPQHSLSLDQAAETIIADERVIVANLGEILDLTHSRDLDIAVDTILSRTGAAGVVVKAGALGALVFQPGLETEGVPAFVTPTVFPIGSGDVFTAALAAHYFDKGNLVAAAHSASRRTAGYVTVRHLGVVDLGNNIDATVVPTVRSVQDPPRVYIAASFANPEQVWSGRTIDRGIRDIGGRSIYPPREVGEKQDAEMTARADLENLDACDAVVLLADVARTGPFFEAGWATCRGIPIVVMNSDPDPDRYTMLNGTGADLVSDLATAAYRAVWAALEHRDGPELAGRLMLLSGGLDSAAVAAVEGPTHALFIDYGQTPAEAEWEAAQAVARHLSLDVERLCVDVSSVGSGLLASTPQMPGAPTPEWFPFRNRFLVTIAAAHAAKHRLGAVLLGVVAGDGDRHSDGTAQFVSTLDLLVPRSRGSRPGAGSADYDTLARTSRPQQPAGRSPESDPLVPCKQRPVRRMPRLSSPRRDPDRSVLSDHMSVPRDRIALMSIRPQFAASILDGSKRVEFRKRPLAADIGTVVIYATKPEGAVLGEFVVDEQAVGTPEELWVRFAEVAGIDRDGFFDYYDGAGQAVGIVIGRVKRYHQPRRLDEVDASGRPPQSFRYLPATCVR